MISFVIKRILYGIPIVLGTTLVLFLIFNVVPGDPALQVVGRHANAESIQNARHELGLDQPLWKQYVQLLKNISVLDMGRSYQTKQDITSMIIEGIGPSLSLAGPAFFIATILSLLIGIFVASYRGSLTDRLVVSFCVAGQSISLLVYILAGQYFMAYKWGYFPISGYESSWDGRWHYLMLPGMIFILLTLAPQVRFYRTVILDEIYQDYVRTARSKGLPGRTVLLRHVLKNAMIPIITDIVINIPFLILGSVLLESFFSIPGIGDLIVRAIANSDRPVLMATTLLGTVAFVAFNIVSDLLYAWVDPRIQVK